MFDFMISTGLVGVIGVTIVFILVFFLAKPDKEISFWGIKFHKKRMTFPTYLFRRYPKPIPDGWHVVFNVFNRADSHQLSINSFYSNIRNEIPELEARLIFENMKDHGLIEQTYYHVALTKRGLKKMAKICNQSP